MAYNRSMHFWRIALSVTLLGLVCDAVSADEPHIRAQMLADVSAITPGRPFMLGVQLSIDPGWHVYWKNPGDAGLPTRVKYNVPDGFTVGPLLFPAPQRIEQPGNIVVLGYENSVLLLAQVTPPARLPEGFTGTFSAAVSWLVCSDVCIPGKTTLSLSLGTSASASGANSELFDATRAQLPVDVANSADVQSAKVNTAAGENQSKAVTITVQWKQAAPDNVQFIPGALDDYNISNTQVQSEGNRTQITFDVRPLAGINPPSATTQCVVAYNNKQGNRRGVNVTLVLP